MLRWSRDGWPSIDTLVQRSDGAEIFVGYADELAGTLADRMAALDIGRVPIVDRTTGRLVGLLARRYLSQVRAHASPLERDRVRLLKFPS